MYANIGLFIEGLLFQQLIEEQLFCFPLIKIRFAHYQSVAQVRYVGQ